MLSKEGLLAIKLNKDLLINPEQHNYLIRSQSAGLMLTLVGNGNFEGSVLQGVWMAVSGGGHD